MGMDLKQSHAAFAGLREQRLDPSGGPGDMVPVANTFIGGDLDDAVKCKDAPVPACDMAAEAYRDSFEAGPVQEMMFQATALGFGHAQDVHRPVLFFSVS